MKYFDIYKILFLFKENNLDNILYKLENFDYIFIYFDNRNKIQNFPYFYKIKNFNWYQEKVFLISVKILLFNLFSFEKAKKIYFKFKKVFYLEKKILKKIKKNCVRMDEFQYVENFKFYIDKKNRLKNIEILYLNFEIRNYIIYLQLKNKFLFAFVLYYLYELFSFNKNFYKILKIFIKYLPEYENLEENIKVYYDN